MFEGVRVKRASSTRPTPESRLRADSIGVRDGSEALCGPHPGGVGELSPLERGLESWNLVLTEVH